MSSRKKLIAGNWKMNKTSSDGVSLVAELVAAIGKQSDVEVVVCPPFTALESAAKTLDGSTLKLGAQNMHFEASGAFTGEISAPMLRALFATHVILGHSERRAIYGETDAVINAKIKKAREANLKPIFCIGETLAEREAGNLESVLRTQITGGLDGVSEKDLGETVIAYEPVWAIGTGVTATSQQAQDAHAFVRSVIAELYGADAAAKIRIQYGGSVKPNNAAELMACPDIDGALIGGAALEPQSFCEIIRNGSAA